MIPMMMLRMMMLRGWVVLTLLSLSCMVSYGQSPDLILHGGKIVTVDDDFTIAEAVAIKGGRILAVGSNNQILDLRGNSTKTLDLQGKTVLPGLIDSHTHPSGASMFEFDHEVPQMESIQDVLDYIGSRAEVVPQGGWITVNQVFITRLREQRYPTRDELDQAAPEHAVVFSTGPDASVSSLALELSGIDKDSRPAGEGEVEKDPQTGEPTGILRGRAKSLLKVKGSGSKATEEDRTERLVQLFHDYNSVGITSVADRNSSGGAISRYQRLKEEGRLTVRMAISHGVPAGREVPLERTEAAIRAVAEHPLRKNGDSNLRIVGVKTFQDGGMLTGSAYMLKPWGVSSIYSITDPRYRGVLFIPKDKLQAIVKATVEQGLQFTAHSVGDGAVTNLVDVYEALSESLPIRDTRSCITHCNFMTRDAVERMARLGVVADIQPAWLYLDAWTLEKQFGYERLAYFQPLQSIFEAGGIAGGGSDHMQKIGSLRSINPYNPFLGMWVTITRQAKWYDGQLHPEQALTRERAIRFYTTNNAYILFLDKEVGSLVPGKAADLIVIDRDILTCPVDEIRDTKVLKTYRGGEMVYEAVGP